MKTTAKAFIPLLILGLISFLPSISHSKCISKSNSEYIIEVEGESAIFKNDKGAAKDMAVKAAQRSAIEQVVGVMVSSETLTENFQLIKDNIYTKSSGFIKCYDILSAKAKNGAMTVKIKAVVAQSNLMNSIEGLGVLVECKNNPRLLVLIGEKTDKDKAYRFWWKDDGASRFAENQLIEYFLEKNFNLIDTQTIKTLGISSDDPKQLASKGKEVGAELILTGRMEGLAAGNIMGTQMKSGQSSLVVRIISVATGRILANTSSSGAGVHVNQTLAIQKSMKKSSKKAGKSLLNKISKLWKKECFGQNSVELTVKGLKYGELQRFRNLIKSTFRGIFTINERRVKKRTALWELKIAGDVSTLAAELSDASFESKTVEILEKTDSSLVIEIKK